MLRSKADQVPARANILALLIMVNAQKSDNYLDQFNAIGEEKFYRSLLSEAINKLIKIKEGNYKGATPEVEMLNSSEKFLQLARKSGEPGYLALARIFRRAAHKIYFSCLKAKMIEKNYRFLNLV